MTCFHTKIADKVVIIVEHKNCRHLVQQLSALLPEQITAPRKFKAPFPKTSRRPTNSRPRSWNIHGARKNHGGSCPKHSPYPTHSRPPPFRKEQHTQKKITAFSAGKITATLCDNLWNSCSLSLAFSPSRNSLLASLLPYLHCPCTPLLQVLLFSWFFFVRRRKK